VDKPRDQRLNRSVAIKFLCCYQAEPFAERFLFATAHHRECAGPARIVMALKRGEFTLPLGWERSAADEFLMSALQVAFMMTTCTCPTRYC